MHATRTTALAFGLAAICAAGIAAQTQETKTTTETKVTLEGGKEVSVMGCLDRRPDGLYSLSEVGGNLSVAPWRYELVTDDDLSKHVGHRVEIHGKAVANGDGRVKFESKVKTEMEGAEDQETKVKTESTKTASDVPFLGVSSVKMLAATCD